MWFEQQIASQNNMTSRGASGPDRDDAAVRIMTIHSSKRTQVSGRFCPYLWDVNLGKNVW